MKTYPFGDGLYDQSVLEFINSYYQKYLTPPSSREVQISCRVGSRANLIAVLMRLERFGKLYHVPGSGTHQAGKYIPFWVKEAIEKVSKNQ